MSANFSWVGVRQIILNHYVFNLRIKEVDKTSLGGNEVIGKRENETFIATSQWPSRKEVARGTRVYTMSKINSIMSVGSSIKTVGF
ncbi:hypothetical protein HYT23_03595 [Candidatus Pacearchaeota archaeon]|nr:hypothetical protein [Candidatus Pacearchaeota archaeon]